jgi:hypothetical protein
MAGNSVLYLDDYDTSLLGLVVETVTGLSDTPALTPRTRERYGWAGMMEVAAYPQLAPRTITVTGTVLAATPAALETAIDALKAKCVPATVRVRFVSNATREWVVRLTELTMTPLPGPMFLAPARSITLKLLALDPYGYDLSSTVIGSIANADSPCAVGTAISRPVLRCTGAATNPLWTYKNQAGTTVRTLQLTITVAGGDWVEVDCAAMTIRKSVSSVITDALTTLTSGDFIALDPKDGTPTLRVSVGTGQATYKKAWL